MVADNNNKKPTINPSYRMKFRNIFTLLQVLLPLTQDPPAYQLEEKKIKDLSPCFRAHGYRRVLCIYSFYSLPFRWGAHDPHRLCLQSSHPPFPAALALNYVTDPAQMSRATIYKIPKMQIHRKKLGYTL